MIVLGLICLSVLAVLGVLFARYNKQSHQIECERLTQQREDTNSGQFKTAFEWDVLALEGVKVGNWRQFRDASESIHPGAGQDFLYSREEFLRVRQSDVPLVNDDDFKTRVWLE
jgi:hypothetical protein